MAKRDLREPGANITAAGDEEGLWMPREGEASFSPEQQSEVRRLEADLRVQLAPKPKRLAHSLSVAREATHLAVLYGVDPYLACVSGILHDWCKVVPHDELIEQARVLGINMGVDLALVEPLLHGKVAALQLPERYPELPAEVWQAIDRHTTGAADMTPLDEVLFVADGIEPRRPSSEGIVASRNMVGHADLDELYFFSFAGGIVYVIQTERYLYPGTIQIYNELVRQRG